MACFWSLKVWPNLFHLSIFYKKKSSLCETGNSAEHYYPCTTPLIHATPLFVYVFLLLSTEFVKLYFPTLCFASKMQGQNNQTYQESGDSGQLNALIRCKHDNVQAQSTVNIRGSLLWTTYTYRVQVLKTLRSIIESCMNSLSSQECNNILLKKFEFFHCQLSYIVRIYWTVIYIWLGSWKLYSS